MLIFAAEKWFRSSVGLEQRPSKAWVLRSSRSGITKPKKCWYFAFFFGLLFSEYQFTTY